MTQPPERPRIVVGVDGSSGSAATLAWALDEARLRQAELDVVHAWHAAPGAAEAGTPVAVAVLVGLAEEDARALLDQLIGGADTSGVPAVAKRLVCDGAAHALLDAAEGADLLVVGAGSRGGVAGAVLGSVADHVTCHATCAVAIIPSVR